MEELVNPTLMHLRMKWYQTPAVKFEMIKHTQYRETAVLLPKWAFEKVGVNQNTRMLKINSVNHFDYVFSQMKLFDRYYNVYSTVARYYNGIPDQTMNLAKRDNSLWNQTHYKDISRYDFFLDIDAPSFEELPDAYHSAKEIKKLFDYEGVPYEIRFSGCGFHFIVPGMLFNKRSYYPAAENNIYQAYHKIAKYLYDHYSEMIDLGIYDSRRLCKVPYSLALYNNRFYVCCPILSDEEFNYFKLEKYELIRQGKGSVDYQTLIFKRGTKLFNADGNVKFFEKIIEGDK